jgi:outer membrane protein
MIRIIPAIIIAFVLLVPMAHAEARIGLIDIRAALFNSEAAKAFTDKIVGQFKQQEMEVRAVGEEGQKLELRLKNDAAIMSDNERAKLAADYEEKVQEYKYLKTRLDKAINEKRNEFLNQSKPRLDQVVNELVVEEKLDLLLPSDVVLFAKPGYDLTQKVVDKLNKLK